MGRRRVMRVWGLGLTIALASLSLGPAGARTTDTLPGRLGDQEFWRLSSEFSEPNGFFRSENLVSNEHTFQYVIPALERVVEPGGVYLGVAPDQNFTYIAAVRPRMAFIVDIRRGNLLQHLMYKALFELSVDRAEFVSRLFAKARPAGLSSESSATELLAAFERVPTDDPTRYRANIRAVVDQLGRVHGFHLTPADLQQVEDIYWQFFFEGPDIRYVNTAPFGRRGAMNFPSWADLVTQTDWDGVNHSYLASEANFQFVKGMQERNLIVPVVGNFAGPRALKAVGDYVRARGVTVSAFYVSNVEQYLFEEGLWEQFALNVTALPVTDRSVFIRSVSSRWGYSGPFQWADGRASALDPIGGLLKDAEAGRIQDYYDLNVRSAIPAGP